MIAEQTNLTWDRDRRCLACGRAGSFRCANSVSGTDPDMDARVGSARPVGERELSEWERLRIAELAAPRGRVRGSRNRSGRAPEHRRRLAPHGARKQQ